jgi:ABC-2 type transport system ATP-binding protein
MFNVDRNGGRALLETSGLVKSYGERIALDGVSLRLHAGEGLALLGTNGSGKTTLLSLCAGALRKDAGRVLVCGRDVSDSSARRLLGFVPQEPALYDELTGEENVRFFGRLAGLRGDALTDNTRVALEAADLSESRQRRARSYSGGMKRRLSVACALVHEPVVLMLDEPFVGIDASSRAKLCELLLARKQKGLALVLSTHRLDEVSALCERSVVLEGGRVVRESENERPAEARVLELRGKASVGGRVHGPFARGDEP